jgi:hypothetical protein
MENLVHRRENLRSRFSLGSHQPLLYMTLIINYTFLRKSHNTTNWNTTENMQLIKIYNLHLEFRSTWPTFNEIKTGSTPGNLTLYQICACDKRTRSARHEKNPKSTSGEHVDYYTLECTFTVSFLLVFSAFSCIADSSAI